MFDCCFWYFYDEPSICGRSVPIAAGGGSLGQSRDVLAKASALQDDSLAQAAAISPILCEIFCHQSFMPNAFGFTCEQKKTGSLQLTLPFSFHCFDMS